MSLAWQDDLELALLLSEKYPGTDPLSVRFKELHRWVTELPEFEDNPKTSNEGVLEAIQMAWYEEYVVRKELD